MTVHVVRSQSQEAYRDSPHWLFQESRYWRCSPIRNLRSRGLEVMFHWRFVVRPLFRTRTRGLGGRGPLLRLSLGHVEIGRNWWKYPAIVEEYRLWKMADDENECWRIYWSTNKWLNENEGGDGWMKEEEMNEDEWLYESEKASPKTNIGSASLVYHCYIFVIDTHFHS